MQKLPTSSRAVSSSFMQKLPKGLCVIENPRAGLDLDGDFFIPVLSAAIAVVLHWADMMPSHSMDLPVPRCTSMLMLGGEFTPCGTKWFRWTLFVSCSKYVSMKSFCFSPDGKFPSECLWCHAASQIAPNYLFFFVPILVKLNSVIFDLTFGFIT